jgi:type VI secretion system secreted protein VgrG
MNTRLAPVMADRWTVAESGLQSFYGDHVTTPDEAARMARLRAELQRCAIDRYDGVTQVTAVRAGATFTLHDHPDATWQREYVPVRVTHRYLLERTPGSSAANAAPRYDNLVEAIPTDVAFRPERVTPRPQMPPWIPAVIDSPANVAQIGSGAQEKLASPLDDEGRYFVVFPFDTVAATGVAASCPISLAQGFAGSGFGQHHPLHQGTHVLVGHVHGDPDRPVIVAALMDSVVHAVASGGLLRTRGGVMVEYEDHAAPWATLARRQTAAKAPVDPHPKK